MSSKSVQKMLSLKLQQHLSLCGASFCFVFGPNEAYAAYLFNLILLIQFFKLHFAMKMLNNWLIETGNSLWKYII